MNIRKIKITLIICLIIAGLISGVYYFISERQEKLRTEMNEHFDKVLHGKRVLFDIDFEDVVVDKGTSPTPSSYIWFNDSLSSGYENKESGLHLLGDYYNLISGGFDIRILEKMNNNSYKLTEIKSGDIGYRTDSEFFTKYGAPSIVTSYHDASDYILGKIYHNITESSDTSIFASLEHIEPLFSYKNKYYYIKPNNSSKFDYSGESEYLNMLYTNVFYKKTGITYEVCLDFKAVLLDYFIYISVGLITIGILYFLIFYNPEKNK